MAIQPTFIVGVGQAGINVLSQMHDLAEERDVNDKIASVAIDTDDGQLEKTPPQTKEILLSTQDGFVREDTANFPYLTKEMNIANRGALRQRPVGRYNLDNSGPHGYQSTWDNIFSDLEDHYENNQGSLEDDDSSFNIFLIHSLAGGTGSGTFPLLSGMVYQMKETLEDRFQGDIYIGGVGVTPRIEFDPEVIESPPGDDIFYPNAFAALNDLYVLTSTQANDAEVYIHSNRFSETSDEDTSKEQNKIEFDNGSPFSNYWIMDVREERLNKGKIDSDRPEEYRDKINNEIANSLLAISRLDESAENWNINKTVLGTLGQAEVRVPHREVKKFCELKKTKETKEHLATEEIPEVIEDLRHRQEELRDLKQMPDPENIGNIDIVDKIQNRVEGEFPSGKHIIDNATKEDIAALFDEIAEKHSPDDVENQDLQVNFKTLNSIQESIEAISQRNTSGDNNAIEELILATHFVDQILHGEHGAPQVEGSWEDTINSLWSKHNLQSKPAYGGDSVSTLSGKATGLNTFYTEKIKEYKEIKEEYEPGIIGQVQGTLPPIITPLENTEEKAERIIDTLQDEYDDFERVDGKWGRVREMQETISDKRKEIRNQITYQLNDVEQTITDLQNLIDDLEREIDEIKRDIRSKRNELTQANTGNRLTILPLKHEKIDDITDETVERTLTDLNSYVEEGFIEKSKVRQAVENSLSFARTWGDSESPVIKKDQSYRGEVKTSLTESDDVATSSSHTERWSLFHEENERWGDTNSITETASKVQKSSGSNGGGPGYISDKYSLSFVTFNRRDPVSQLEIFQRLNDMYNDGTLKRWAGNYDDYRQAFAYIEWYPQEIRNAFNITGQVDVPKPPEIDKTRIDSEDDIGPYIRTNGLDLYLWKGNMWDRYNQPDGNSFTGWNEKFETKGLAFKDLQRSTASKDIKSQWLADQADWEEVLAEYEQNLVDETGIKIQFVDDT